MVRSAEAGEPEFVVVLATLGAPKRRTLSRGRARAMPPEPPSPAPVATARATVIATAPLDDEALAQTWLHSANIADEAAVAIAVLNQLIYAQRIATADPHLHEVALTQAIAIRCGYGEGEKVADGRFSEALELPVATLARQQARPSGALRPQERLAALLAGRDRPLHCEELALRARSDVDAGRGVAAALAVGVAMDAAFAELDGVAGLGERLTELRVLREGVAGAARDALTGPPSAQAPEAVVFALGRLEAVLRARTAAGVP